MSASHEITPGACTIQSIRALENHIDTRGPEALRDALEFLAQAVSDGKHVTISVRELALSDFKPGQRVQLAVWTDTWMRGDRYGEVLRIGSKYVWVKLDRSGRERSFTPDMISEVVQ